MAPLEPEGGPVTVRVANCQSVSAGVRKSSAIFVDALTRGGRFGVPQVVLASECGDFDAASLAAEHGWVAAQFTDSTATAGSVVAWRDGELLKGPLLLVGSEAGEGIRARHVVQVKLDIRGHREWFTAGHAPPDRAPVRQRSWLDSARRWRGVVGADFNTWPKQLTKLFRRQVRGVEVLALLVPNRIGCSAAWRKDIGSDHPAVDVRLWPNG